MEAKGPDGKFVGVFPRERDLVHWIKSTWNPKGHYDIHLGSKGFFNIIFFNQEDKDRVLEEGPYFLFLNGIYLETWKEIFNPKIEDMTESLVWICLIAFP